MSSKKVELRIGRQMLQISNPDKVLYPQQGFTKSQVIAYYSDIAQTILPYLRDRPLTLKRYPDGVEKPFFYEKHCPDHRPEFVQTVKVDSERNEDGITYCTVRDAATLIWVANLASLELHVLLFRAAKPDRPTMMVFDLDPGAPANVLDCARVALEFRDMLRHFGLDCLVKTSGSKGLHIMVPLNTAVTFDQTKPMAHAMAMVMEKADPKRVTTNMKRDLRGGKVFIDWSQNDEHKTTVCAYSLRGTTTPSVSTPITWAEVSKAVKAGNADAFVFSPADVMKRIKQKGDLLEPLLSLKQKLPKANAITPTDHVS
jgi:bifunctional non-homologous end joining protein LigD